MLVSRRVRHDPSASRRAPRSIQRFACALLLGLLSGCPADEPGFGHGPGRADVLVTLWRDLGLPTSEPRSAWGQFWGPADVHAIAIGPGATADSSSVANFIRSRTPQLRYCYVERGLKQQIGVPLQGELTVGLSFGDDGAVRHARVLNRSADWEMVPGSSVEACVLARVRRWRVPSREAPSATLGVRWSFVPPQRADPIQPTRPAGAT